MEQLKHSPKQAAEGYDFIARTVFLPLFPIIADKALRVFGADAGRCLDLGCGGGMFGYHLAKISNLSVTFLDINEEAIGLCKARGDAWGLASRCAHATGDVHALPFPDACFDLIISRGSIGFWGEEPDLETAFREIWRVLAPGGKTLVGGSLGTPDIAASIIQKMKTVKPEWSPGCSEDRIKKDQMYRRILDRIGATYRLDNDETGNWIVMEKT